MNKTTFLNRQDFPVAIDAYARETTGRIAEASHALRVNAPLLDPFAPLDAPLAMPEQVLEGRASAPTDNRDTTAHSVNIVALRLMVLTFSVIIAAFALFLFLKTSLANGIDALDSIRGLLLFVTTWWLAWKAAHIVLGLTFRQQKEEPDVVQTPSKPTIILMPLHNEDPLDSLTRLAAMDTSLKACGVFDMHFAVLSDTTDDAIAERERTLFYRLVAEAEGIGRFFYRRRPTNEGKKAGNIKNFLVRSGGAYDYAIILDADSLLEGATICKMIQRMEAAPRLGLLQTLPLLVRAHSVFARVMQFSASLYSPAYCRGLSRLQGKAGPFWGHNAIVRVSAFAASCGLPKLRGAPPFGGHIMSHDYVEAALLARAGWAVQVDETIAGSYEEGPASILEHAKRDRRWCQGNLQHSRVIRAPHLRPWSRFTFLQGIMSYLSSLLWLAFILLLVVVPHKTERAFVGVENGPPATAQAHVTTETVWLIALIAGLLLLPQCLVVLSACWSRRAKQFGGSARLLVSLLVELLLSFLIAPLLLMFTNRSIFEVLLGKDGGWPTNNRGDSQLSFVESVRASRWIVTIGLIGLAAVWLQSFSQFLWLLPIGLPMLCAPLLIWRTAATAKASLCPTPIDSQPPAIVATHDHFRSQWGGE